MIVRGRKSVIITPVLLPRSQRRAQEEYEVLRRYKRSGRSLRSESFPDRLEILTFRTLKKQKPGPKKNNYIWCPRKRVVYAKKEASYLLQGIVSSQKSIERAMLQYEE